MWQNQNKDDGLTPLIETPWLNYFIIFKTIFNTPISRNFQAKLLFQLTREELKKLRVPEEALEEVMAQGFTKLESRLALRASQNNPTLAVKNAQDTRQKREEEDEAEHERNKKRRKLGKINRQFGKLAGAARRQIVGLV